MGDPVQSIRGKSGGRIASVIAQARQQVANPDDPTFAPSLDNPSRPKTPAGFDDRMSMDSTLSFHKMKTAASSRQQAALRNSNLMRGSLSKISKINEIKAAPVTASPSIVNDVEPVPSLRMADSAFNPRMLQRDLSEIETVCESIAFADLNRMLSDQINELIRFLQSLQPGTKLALDLVSAIEDIVMKFSGVALMMLRRDDTEPVEVLSLLRLNLRILAPMFTSSYVPSGGAFDVGIVTLMLKQCTQAMYQLCATNLSPDVSGNMVLELVATPQNDDISYYGNTSRPTSGDIYQALDDDIEEENAEGQFVPMKPSPASFRVPSASADTNNNCELVGTSQLLQFLDLLWPAIYAEVNSQKTGGAGAEPSAILPYLIEAAYYIMRVFAILSLDETDCKRLNIAGAVKALVKGVKVFQTSSMLSCIKLALAQHSESDDDDQSDTIYINCLTQILSVLRNFSTIKSCRSQLLEQDVIRRLCLLTKSYLQQPRVVVNCARVLAKLSPLDSGREKINADPEHIHWLVNVVIHEATQMGGPAAAQEQEQEQEWPGEHTWAILTRICFTLGNLTTTNEKNRHLIGTEFGLTEHLVLLLHVCAESLQRMCRRDDGDRSGSDSDGDEENESGDGADDSFLSEQSDSPMRSAGKHASKTGGKARADVNVSIDNFQPDADAEADGEDQNNRAGEREFVDATIKLVRLLANLSIDEKIGTVLGSKPDTLEMLVKLLLSAMEGGSPGHEELLLNVIAACTNITFYSSQYVNKNGGKTAIMSSPKPGSRATVSDRILEVSTQLSAHLGQCLFHENSEIVLESARVLGNLTRTAAIRSSLIDTRADETLVILLKHDQWDIVAAVTGVLVNLSADAHCKAALLKPSSHLLIVFSVVLRKVDTDSMELSCLICQALYNLLLGAPPAGSGSDSRTIQERIHKILAELNSTIRDGGGGGVVAEECVSFVKVSAAVMALIEKNRSSQEAVV